MLRLSNGGDLCDGMGACAEKTSHTWRKRTIKVARDRAKEGDTQAMIVLYIAKQGLRWLEKAADAGDGSAQQLLASAYKSGRGWFPIPGSRDKAVEKWFKSSAETGYPQGMYFYANYLYTNNRSNKEVGYWLQRSAEAGHIDALGGYALNVAHLPDSYGFPLDRVKAYGLTYILSNLKGGGSDPEEAQKNLSRIAEKMSSQEIRQGKIFAGEWQKNHPPPSYFAPIYGY
ncbi:tetratricopeptide repeat protein [Pseudomonas sp. SDO528_S397]